LAVFEAIQMTNIARVSDHASEEQIFRTFSWSVVLVTMKGLMSWERVDFDCRTFPPPRKAC
jgi:hypothetical protein